MWSKIIIDTVRFLLWCVVLGLLTRWVSFESTVLMALGYIIATIESEKINKRETNDK